MVPKGVLPFWKLIHYADHVSDVVQHLILALPLASTAAPICNVCRGRPVSVRSLAAAVMEVLDRQVAVRHEPARPGEIRHSVGSTAGAERLLGFTARVELIEGLRLMLGTPPR
jgi:nucleoside-diphosphate-sugar epimerase